MRALIAAALAALLVLPVGLSARADDDPCTARICAGAGRADMTPPVGVPMGGYFARSAASGPEAWAEQITDRGPDPNLYAKSFRQSEGIHTTLHARALVVQAPDGRRYAFASVENRGAPFELHQAVARRLADAGADIPSEHLLFSSTHSHAAPSPLNPYAAYGAISADLFDPRVFEIVAEALTAAILDGVDRLEPARLGVGRHDLDGASRNRRMEQFALNPEAPDDARPDEAPAVDPAVTVLRAEADDGRPIGAFSVFALHGTTLGDSNDLLSGDNMGPSMRSCEAALRERGATDPVCAQGNGAEGDISPDADVSGLWVEGGYARAARTGEQVAQGVLAAWDDATPAEDTDLDARFHVLYFRGQDGDPGEPSSPVPMVGVGGNFGDGLAFPVEVAPGQGGKIPIGSGAGGYPQWAPVQVVRIGGTALTAVPGEMTTTMGRRVRAAVLDAASDLLDDVVIVGLANAYVSYMTTPEEYEAHRYEGAWSLYGPQTGNVIRNELVRLAADMAAGVHGDDAGAPPLGELLAAPEAPPLPTDDPFRVGDVVENARGATQRGEIASFSWVGGNPAVDRPRGEVFVRLERDTGEGWQTVATEDDTWTAVRVDRTGPAGPHRWTVAADLPLDLPVGFYRFRVAGRYAAPTGVFDYSSESVRFRIAPAEALLPDLWVEGTTVTVRGLWPRPDGERYALRPREAADGTAKLTIMRSSEPVGSFTLALGQPAELPIEPGDELHIGPDDLRDERGNRNGAAFVHEVV